NDGSAGWIFDGDPTASFALVTLNGAAPASSDTDGADHGGAHHVDPPRTEGAAPAGDHTAAPPRPTVSSEIKRAEYDVLTVSNAISARGLPGDVYRAATVRTGKLVRRRTAGRVAWST